MTLCEFLATYYVVSFFWTSANLWLGRYEFADDLSKQLDESGVYAFQSPAVFASLYWACLLVYALVAPVVCPFLLVRAILTQHPPPPIADEDVTEEAAKLIQNIAAKIKVQEEKKVPGQDR